jgi:hypothetical protein
MRRGAIAIVVGLALGASGLGFGPAGGGVIEEASAVHRPCGVITKGSRAYRVYQNNLRCRKARRGVRKYLRGDGPLRGFSCDRSDPNYSFYCRNSSGRKAYAAKRL